MTQPVVLIAGAGVAGLTAAIALARGGAHVVLAERRAGFSEVGAGLQLSPNATSVLARLNLLNAVRREACLPQRLTVQRWEGVAPLAGMAMNADPAPDGAPFLALRRADLQTALVDELRLTPNLKLMVGRRLTGFREEQGRITAELESDSGRRDSIAASVLIGADGVWSAVRAGLGDATAPQFLGYEAWRTLIPVEAAAESERAPLVNLWLGREAHAVHYPVAGSRMINLVVIRGGRDAAQGWSREGDPAALAPLIARAAPPLARLMRASPGWQVWSLFDRPPAAMAQGRVALIGDAAHPVLPFLAQGAAMGIEDAGALAGHLLPALTAPEPDAIATALARFARERRARVARVQGEGRKNGRVYHAGFPLAAARDLALRAMGETGMRRRYEWLYGWRLGG
jgi:salicylate hydroxylase